MGISNSELGKATTYPTHYDVSLLFPISRNTNREKYDIVEEKLPFVGYDVWNCYEISFLTNRNLPVSGILKIRYSSDSESIIESKSLKLYLNSFNLENMGPDTQSATSAFIDTVKQDLTRVLRTPVYVSFFNKVYHSEKAFENREMRDLAEIIGGERLNKIVISEFTENPELLFGAETDTPQNLEFKSDLLRSNCPVTNQPDWGDLFCVIESNYKINLEGIVQYLVSFRKENHFHEEVVEMIYKRFLEKFKPTKLMIAAQYTRRGGIDINPIRASHPALLDSAFLSTENLLAKSPRQ